MNPWFEILKRHASNRVPVREGETYEQYRARLTEILTPGQRAMIAASIVEESKQLERARVARRQIWVATARLAFDPGPRCPCAVCLQYGSITEAHHIYPLSLQFDDGLAQPVQEFCWLCPTHHSLMHEIIQSLMATRQPRLEGVPFDERGRLDKLGVRFVELRQRPRGRGKGCLANARLDGAREQAVFAL